MFIISPVDLLNMAIEAVKQFGFVKGTFLLFFWLAHIWIFIQYRERLKDRQKQIDALAVENKEYRQRFLDILDQRFGYTNTQGAPQSNQSIPTLPSPQLPVMSPDPDVPSDETNKTNQPTRSARKGRS